MSEMGPTRTSRPSCGMSVLPPTTDIVSQTGYARKVPCVDGSGLAREIFTSQTWSVQPCVRPVGAVHMTAGHNAVRGSGPGQNLAFDAADSSACHRLWKSDSIHETVRHFEQDLMNQQQLMLQTRCLIGLWNRSRYMRQ